MPARKRGWAEIEPDEPLEEEPPQISPQLKKLRNTWEFANVYQYIAIFGNVIKVDGDLGIDEFEAACMDPNQSRTLAEIGLCMLKHVSSHHPLTLEKFDEYTRRQYAAKLPEKTNPFGSQDELESFMDFDIFLKLRVLEQLSRWTFINPKGIREMMGKEELEERQWRCEPIGYDRQGREYIILDDNRLYRKTLPPLPSRSKSKSKSKSKARPRAGTRHSKRRKVNEAQDATEDQEEDEEESVEVLKPEEDTLGGMKWECIAVTLKDYHEFMATIERSKDAGEKALHTVLRENCLDTLVEAEEEKRRINHQKLKQNLVEQKLLHAKRSSRLASKQVKEREEAEAQAAEQKRLRELTDAQKLMANTKRREQDRQSRMLTREQRVKEREAKRVLEEEELKHLTEIAERSEEPENEVEARVSKRQLNAKISRKQKEVEELDEEEDWFFDCSGCGVHGENIDDGEHSMACERCNVWQHSSCLGIAEAEAEKDDFHFICADCRRKEEEAKLPKPPPIRINLMSSSPPTYETAKLAISDTIEVQVPSRNPPAPSLVAHNLNSSDGAADTPPKPHSLPPIGHFHNVVPVYKTPVPSTPPMTNGHR